MGRILDRKKYAPLPRHATGGARGRMGVRLLLPLLYTPLVGEVGEVCVMPAAVGKIDSI
jgi:hypothetical protein